VTVSAVGLGANLGDRRAALSRAIAGLERLGERIAVSSLYETAPVGGPAQDDFANAVALLDSRRSARGVLGGLLRIEREAGRVRGERWGPRVLDLDLLLHGGHTIDVPGLTVPHPRIAERRFVLEPLLEVWPDAVLPDGTEVAELLEPTRDQEVRKIAGPGWWEEEGTGH
jgi:2-amino-4-hydroxy-6-hydroxymethyldihydropteridine diphosphokinase